MWHRATQPERKQQKICINDNIQQPYKVYTYVRICVVYKVQQSFHGALEIRSSQPKRQQQQQTENWPKQWTTKRQSTCPIKAINQQKAKRKGKREEIAGQPHKEKQIFGMLP